MAVVINGSGTVTGISVGGLPDGIVDSGTLATDSVSAAKIAANSVDSAELIDGSIDTSHLASGVGGSAIQQVRYQTTTKTTVTANIPEDATIPQNDEGAELFTLAITPTSASSVLMFDIGIMFGTASGNANPFCVALFQDSTASALACRAHRPSTNYYPVQNNFSYYMTAGTTSSTTFKVRVGMNSGTCYINRDGETTNHDWGGMVSYINITEYAS